MRILFVGLPESSHTAGWVTQLGDTGWDLHLYPSVPSGITHPALEGVDVHHRINRGWTSRAHRSIRRALARAPRAANLGKRALALTVPKSRVDQLVRLIRRLRPDVVHSLQTSPAGYLVAGAASVLGGQFPTWIHSTWGSDLFLFGRFAEHHEKIREVMSRCDYLICECDRDIDLARQFGFDQEVLAADLPVAGGLDLAHCSTLRGGEAPSRRRTVLLKGNSGIGRGLVGLRALERCADVLTGYRIVIHYAQEEVRMASRLFQDSTGLPIDVLPPTVSADALLESHGRARVHLALSISDGVPYSLLSAMVMGAFPIQSSTSCASTWIESGRNGILVPPDDVEVVEQAVRRSLTDDELVESAATVNDKLASEQLGRPILQERAIALYRSATCG